MRNAVSIFFLLTFFSVHVHGQDEDREVVVGEEYTTESIPTTPHTTISPSGLEGTKTYNSEKIPVRKFDDNKWRKVVGNADYDNIKSKPKPKPKSTADQRESGQEQQQKKSGRRYAEREADFEEEESDNSTTSLPFAGPLMQILFYGLIVCLIGFIIFYIVKNTSLKSNPKVVPVEGADASNQVEDINDLDIDSLLKKTQAAGNYRLLLRIYFLGLLKKLNEVGFISWKKDKTNREYLGELFSKPQYFDDVRKLTLAYEQVWYGEHTLPVEDYQQLMEEFKAIDQKLKAFKPL